MTHTRLMVEINGENPAFRVFVVQQLDRYTKCAHKVTIIMISRAMKHRTMSMMAYSVFGSLFHPVDPRVT